MNSVEHDEAIRARHREQDLFSRDCGLEFKFHLAGIYLPGEELYFDEDLQHSIRIREQYGLRSPEYCEANTRVWAASQLPLVRGVHRRTSSVGHGRPGSCLRHWGWWWQ